MSWKQIASWFVFLVFSVWAMAALIVTFAPILGMCFGVVYAACQSGNLWYLFVAQWILPVFLVAITSPFWVDYLNLRNERKMRREAEEDAAAEAEDKLTGRDK